MEQHCECNIDFSNYIEYDNEDKVIELEKMINNDLVDFETAPQDLPDRSPRAFKKECVLKEFLETRCFSDQDCQRCLNAPDGFCKDFKCDYKTKWQLFFPMRKLPKFGRELEMNKNDNLDLPSFNFSVDSE